MRGVISNTCLVKDEIVAFGMWCLARQNTELFVIRYKSALSFLVFISLYCIFIWKYNEENIFKNNS